MGGEFLNLKANVDVKTNMYELLLSLRAFKELSNGGRMFLIHFLTRGAEVGCFAHYFFPRFFPQ